MAGMRPIAVAALALVATLALALGSASAAKPHPRCEQRGTTVERSKHVRVFATDRDGDQALYACWRPRGRPQLLAAWFSCGCSIGDAPAASAELHAGRYVEVTVPVNCGPFPAPGCGGATISLRDVKLRTEVVTEADVTDLVKLGRNRYAYADGRVVVVEGEAQQVLDPGPAVEAGSLAAAGQRLYWLRGGAPFTALAG